MYRVLVGCGTARTHTLLAQMQNDTIDLENWQTVSYKDKMVFKV